MKCQITKCPAYLKGEEYFCNYGFSNPYSDECEVELHYSDANNTMLEAQEIMRIFEKELKNVK